jgi:hypothetical protein
LTDDDLKFQQGHEDEVIGRVQRRTGQTREEVGESARRRLLLIAPRYRLRASHAPRPLKSQISNLRSQIPWLQSEISNPRSATPAFPQSLARQFCSIL